MNDLLNTVETVVAREEDRAKNLVFSPGARVHDVLYSDLQATDMRPTFTNVGILPPLLHILLYGPITLPVWPMEQSEFRKLYGISFQAARSLAANDLLRFGMYWRSVDEWRTALSRLSDRGQALQMMITSNHSICTTPRIDAFYRASLADFDKVRNETFSILERGIPVEYSTHENGLGDSSVEAQRVSAEQLSVRLVRLRAAGWNEDPFWTQYFGRTLERRIEAIGYLNRSYINIISPMSSSYGSFFFRDSWCEQVDRMCPLKEVPAHGEHLFDGEEVFRGILDWIVSVWSGFPAPRIRPQSVYEDEVVAAVIQATAKPDWYSVTTGLEQNIKQLVLDLQSGLTPKDAFLRDIGVKLDVQLELIKKISILEQDFADAFQPYQTFSIIRRTFAVGRELLASRDTTKSEFKDTDSRALERLGTIDPALPVVSITARFSP